ncbi:hypothetical protein MVEN_01838600 [Mycena venus]|uniref:Uncharacterized protein n=1 Tax=Mycena venus TaxID=2733690 RepID=A0A8H7CLU7_9AGAR|nr:hypothetical protein MVEN_01838600 [Mycena venus]
MCLQRRRKPDTEPKTAYDPDISDMRTALDGGHGGDGGHGERNGGRGGRGMAATVHIRDAALVSSLKGGQGGAGGTGNVDGGPGGTGEGAEFATDLAPFNWSAVTIPRMTIADFCTQYELGPEIQELLTGGGYRWVRSLINETDSRVRRSNTSPDGDPKFKNGHISEIKRALEEFYHDCR